MQRILVKAKTMGPRHKWGKRPILSQQNHTLSPHTRTVQLGGGYTRIDTPTARIDGAMGSIGLANLSLVREPRPGWVITKSDERTPEVVRVEHQGSNTVCLLPHSKFSPHDVVGHRGTWGQEFATNPLGGGAYRIAQDAPRVGSAVYFDVTLPDPRAYTQELARAQFATRLDTWHAFLSMNQSTFHDSAAHLLLKIVNSGEREWAPAKAPVTDFSAVRRALYGALMEMNCGTYIDLLLIPPHAQEILFGVDVADERLTFSAYFARNLQSGFCEESSAAEGRCSLTDGTISVRMTLNNGIRYHFTITIENLLSEFSP